jgi:hypothetical protein
MQQLQKRFGRAGIGAAVALIGAISLVVAACTSQPSLSPASPTGSVGSLNDKDDGRKGVICHATGKDGKFVGVIVGLQGTDETTTTFANNGHLDEQGSTEDGHELDFYLGPNPPNEKEDCGEPEPSPSPSATPA